MPADEQIDASDTRSRFRLVTAVAAPIALAALFLLGGYLFGESSDRPRDEGPSWSAWKPSGSGAGGAGQIAGHVGRRYRQADGRPLVRVEGGGLAVAGLPLTVATRASAQTAGDLRPLPGKGVLYRLCGLGSGCAAPEGEPSVQRHLLLRREALELALYSLKYLDGIEQVVILMPPRPGDQPGQALHFTRRQVAAELTKPLDATLVDRTPTVSEIVRSPDTLIVEQITIPKLFGFTLTQAGRGDRTFLVLDPLGSQAPEFGSPGAPGSGGRSRTSS